MRFIWSPSRKDHSVGVLSWKD